MNRTHRKLLRRYRRCANRYWFLLAHAGLIVDDDDRVLRLNRTAMSNYERANWRLNFLLLSEAQERMKR